MEEEHFYISRRERNTIVFDSRGNTIGEAFQFEGYEKWGYAPTNRESEGVVDPTLGMDRNEAEGELIILLFRDE